MMQIFISATRRDDKIFHGTHEDDFPVVDELVERKKQVYSIFFTNNLKYLLNLLAAPRLKAQRNFCYWDMNITIIGQQTSTSSSKKTSCYICDHFFDRSNNTVIYISRSIKQINYICNLDFFLRNLMTSAV